MIYMNQNPSRENLEKFFEFFRVQRWVSPGLYISSVTLGVDALYWNTFWDKNETLQRSSDDIHGSIDNYC